MDLILHNGKIKTDEGYVSAAGCKDEYFAITGTDEQVLKEKTEKTRVIDLKGQLVLPGFNDSHMHFLGQGYYMSILDLRSAVSIEDAIEMGKKYIEENQLKSPSWLEACNWNDVNLAEGRMFNRYDLDRISTEVPVAATRVCGHIISVNSKALELLGFQKGTSQPEDGHFEVDQDGEPTGILNELAYTVTAILPNPSVEDIKKMLLIAGKEANEKGLTSVQTDDLEMIPTEDTADIIQAYMELTEERKLAVRVCEQCCLPDMEKLDRFYKRGFHYGYGNDYFRIGPVKLIGDGSLGSRTAWLNESYSDDEGNVGVCVYKDSKQLDDLVERAHLEGQPVAVHCIGDAANEQIIDAIEKAMKKHPEIHNRHGIVHAQILNRGICERMKELNIMAYIQPVFIQSDFEMAESRVGKDRMKYSYNWKMLDDMGVVEAMGTDCPVEDMSPIANIYSAVTRKDLGGTLLEGWYPKESLTVEQAIEFYTKTGAYASGEEDKKGSIKVGMLADMTVIDRNLYTIAPDEIKDAKVTMTIVGGTIKYWAN